MHPRKAFLSLMAIATLALPAAGAESTEATELNELRNTVVNLLEGLVSRGVITREQAEQMVKNAQAKASADAAADAELARQEQNAVRVPFIPQVVREEIRKEVAAELGASVTRDVIATAQSQGWGVPAALPDWVRRMNWSGDVRVRGQGDLFASGNIDQGRVNYQRVNELGGKIRAGLDQYANSSVDRKRMRARARFGFDATLGSGWSLGARLATGTLVDPVSSNQSLGNMSARYQTGLDLAYVRWTGISGSGTNYLDLQGGRINNPWMSTDLVFDRDLTFEGMAANYRLGFGSANRQDSYVFLTVGGFPLEEIELAKDKWLLAGQLGFSWKLAESGQLRLAAAVYDYREIEGRRNAFDSELLDYTAPRYLQGGNSLFDIRNDNDVTTNLYALASSFRVADVTASYQWRMASGFSVELTGDYAKNIGFDAEEIRARTGFDVEKHTTGYQGELSLGSADMARTNAWRAYFGYRYLERDAVLDAFTDSDFRLGGTDVKGFFLGGDWAFSPRVLARLRYMSGDEIHGTVDNVVPEGSIERVPFGVDVVQLDVTARF